MLFFKSLDGEISDKKKIKEEWASAKGVDSFRFGETLLIQKSFLLTRYVRYSEIQRAFLRIESGEYGDIQLDNASLVLIMKNGEERIIPTERRQVVDAVLSYFKEMHPHIEIGKKPGN